MLSSLPRIKSSLSILLLQSLRFHCCCQQQLLRFLPLWSLHSSLLGTQPSTVVTTSFLASLLALIALLMVEISIPISPTGRFCNGRIPVDYLGELEDMLRGYASGSQLCICCCCHCILKWIRAGSTHLIHHQIQQFSDTYQQFVLSLGEDAAIDLISSSVIYISIGMNDYIHYYLCNVSNVQNLYLPWGFNQFLASTMKQEIKILYHMNFRKLIVMGLRPIGRAPYYFWRYKSKKGKCVEYINDMIMEFTFIISYMTEELFQEFPDNCIIFCDAFQGSMDIIWNHNHYGFNATAQACRGSGKHKGRIICMSLDMACPNASNHIWWDQFHPTDALNAILADNVWSSRHTEICYPMNLEKNGCWQSLGNLI